MKNLGERLKRRLSVDKSHAVRLVHCISPGRIDQSIFCFAKSLFALEFVWVMFGYLLLSLIFFTRAGLGAVAGPLGSLTAGGLGADVVAVSRA